VSRMFDAVRPTRSADAPPAPYSGFLTLEVLEPGPNWDEATEPLANRAVLRRGLAP